MIRHAITRILKCVQSGEKAYVKKDLDVMSYIRSVRFRKPASFITLQMTLHLQRNRRNQESHPDPVPNHPVNPVGQGKKKERRNPRKMANPQRRIVGMPKPRRPVRTLNRGELQPKGLFFPNGENAFASAFAFSDMHSRRSDSRSVPDTKSCNGCSLCTMPDASIGEFSDLVHI